MLQEIYGLRANASKNYMVSYQGQVNWNYVFRIIFTRRSVNRAKIKIVLVSVGCMIDNPIRDMGIRNLHIRKGISISFVGCK